LRFERASVEFEALNSPAFNARGAVTDEWIAIFKQLWSQSPASFDGRFSQYTDIRCEPFPVQKPQPPIWVGGHSRAALRRTARHGEGWHSVGAVAASPLPPQEMRAHLDTLKQLTEAEGRDFSALTISYKAPLYDTGIIARWVPPNFSGEPEDIASDVRTFATIGVHELIFDCRGQSIAQSIERLQWFATEVIPLVDG
jgi:Luciferase-like monooxygenase